MQRIPSRPFIDNKGVAQGWSNVQEVIELHLRRRFPGVDYDIREDAIATAMLRLLTYWQFLASSKSKEDIDKLTFVLAIIYGERFAVTSIFSELSRRKSEVAGYFNGGVDNEDDVDDSSAREFDIVSTESSLDELVEDDDYVERTRKMLLALPSAELEDYMRNLLTPLTEREQAQKEGVTQQSIHERREVRKKRATKLARSYGLV